VIGTGPYRVSEWLPGEQLMLQAFEAYWQGPQPGTTTLIFRWNFDEVQRLMDLQAGVADGVDNISSFDFDTVQSDPNLALIPRPPLSTAYIGMNNTASPFDDERVRQAIAMGINRNELVEMNFPGGFQVAQYFTPCVIPNGCEGDAWYAFDPLRAQALLEEAGYLDGFRTVLTYRDVARGYLPRPGVVAEALKDQLWENLGIYAQLEVVDSDAFLQAVDNGELSGLYLLGWGADYPDVANFLDTHFGKQASLQFGDKYVDLVELLREASAIYGDEARRPYYKVANNMIRLHVPAIPLAQGDWYAQGSLAAAYRKSVVGAHASPFGFESFAAMSADGQDIFLWEQSAEPLSLYCADETDSDSLRACSQILEPLYRYQAGGVVPEPALAESCTPEADLMAWVCKLRESVQFHDGSWLDANDVVTSFWVQWDAAHPFRRHNTFSFDYFHDYWGEFLNATSQ
jgi:ABC-type transport system substrate-binding protein